MVTVSKGIASKTKKKKKKPNQNQKPQIVGLSVYLLV